MVVFLAFFFFWIIECTADDWPGKQGKYG